jgi:uncharacterized membrane protein (UPF0127 family)
MSLDNKQQMEILKNAVKEGYRGSYTELWTAADPETQQENVEVAETPQQQEQGLGGRAAQDMPDAMVFPESQGDFNTNDMQAPIDIEKYGPQGDLVQSYKSVPPGINNLPMGDDVGTVIERPADYQDGGVKKYQETGLVLGKDLGEAIDLEYFRGQEILSKGEETPPDHIVHNFVNFVNTGYDERLAGTNGMGKARGVRDALLTKAGFDFKAAEEDSFKLTKNTQRPGAYEYRQGGFFPDNKVKVSKKGGFFNCK